MHQYMPFSPVEIEFSSYEQALKYLEGLISDTDNTLLFISKGMAARMGLDKWLSVIKSSFKLIHIDDIPVNPTVVDVYEILSYLRGVSITRILAVGGGSCIDLAKAVSALHNLISSEKLSEQAVYNAIKNKEYLLGVNFIDIIALPTTAGTGTEVTKWATIWDMVRKEKLSIDCLQLYPKAALIIPELTVFMPKRLTLSTGLDALSHAMEAFWARSRTPLSQALALTAVKHIKEYLSKVLENGGDIELRKDMCLASLLAGLAFSITRTTACHSISYPLTMFFGIEHGFAAAMTLASSLLRKKKSLLLLSNLMSSPSLIL